MLVVDLHIVGSKINIGNFALNNIFFNKIDINLTKYNGFGVLACHLSIKKKL